MWERKSKDQYGSTVQIIKENPFTKQPVYDDLSPTGSSYNKAKLTAQYTVEWLPERNFAAYERAQKIGSEINPWELNNEYLTDSLGLAIRELVMRTLDGKSDNARLYMYIKDADGNDAEVCAEVPSDTERIIRNMVQSNINKQIDSLTETVNSLTNELKSYKDFIAKYNADELFREFISSH